MSERTLTARARPEPAEFWLRSRACINQSPNVTSRWDQAPRADSNHAPVRRALPLHRTAFNGTPPERAYLFFAAGDGALAGGSIATGSKSASRGAADSTPPAGTSRFAVHTMPLRMKRRRSSRAQLR